MLRNSSVLVFPRPGPPGAARVYPTRALPEPRSRSHEMTVRTLLCSLCSLPARPRLARRPSGTARARPCARRSRVSPPTSSWSTCACSPPTSSRAAGPAPAAKRRRSPTWSESSSHRPEAGQPRRQLRAGRAAGRLPAHLEGSFATAAGVRELAFPDDWVAVSRHAGPRIEVEKSEVVFVGYGVVAPEYGWDDFKGVDVRGKTVVMLVNDPAVPDPRTRGARRPALPRQGDDLLRALDVQVRDRLGEGGRRGDPRPRDGPGGLPL